MEVAGTEAKAGTDADAEGQAAKGVGAEGDADKGVGAEGDAGLAGQSQILTSRPFLSKWGKIWI